MSHSSANVSENNERKISGQTGNLTWVAGLPIQRPTVELSLKLQLLNPTSTSFISHVNSLGCCNPYRVHVVARNSYSVDPFIDQRISWLLLICLLFCLRIKPIVFEDIVEVSFDIILINFRFQNNFVHMYGCANPITLMVQQSHSAGIT